MTEESREKEGEIQREKVRKRHRKRERERTVDRKRLIRVEEAVVVVAVVAVFLVFLFLVHPPPFPPPRSRPSRLSSPSSSPFSVHLIVFLLDLGSFLILRSLSSLSLFTHFFLSSRLQRRTEVSFSLMTSALQDFLSFLGILSRSQTPERRTSLLSKKKINSNLSSPGDLPPNLLSPSSVVVSLF